MDEARWLVQRVQAPTATYMMAENYTYMRANVLVRAMVEAGLFGEVYYAEGEYLHELSSCHHMPDGRPTWRYYWQVGVNGCTYPTHSLGPCLQWVQERAERISCIGTGRWTDPEHSMEDTVLLLCKTGSGKLMRVRVDMLSKRPHAMTNYTLQGTKGCYESPRRAGEGHWVWLEGLLQRPQRMAAPRAVRRVPARVLARAPPEVSARPATAAATILRSSTSSMRSSRRRPASVGIHEAMDMTLPGLVSQESIRRGGEWLPVPDSRAW